MAIRAILFDKDGTLIDCDRTWAPVIHHLAEALAPPGEVDALVDAAGLDPRTQRFRAGSVWGAGSTRDLVSLWWPDASAAEAAEHARAVDAICAEMGPRHSAPLVELAPLFEALRARGLAVGIATNDSEASLRAFLRFADLDRHVDCALGYDSVAAAKPAGDMVHAFCEAVGIPPGQTAVVGDNTHDLEMARAGSAGYAVAVLSGNGTPADLAHLADATIADIGGLIAWLDSLDD